MKLSGIIGIFVGVMMLAQWTFFLAAGQVPEIQTEPWRIALHLAAEFITAVGLIASGTAIVKRSAWGAKVYPVFAGMLIYSVIASSGYFAQHGQWTWVGMFAVLLILAVASIFIVAHPK